MNQPTNTELIEIENLLELRTFAYDILRRTFLEEPSKELVKQFENGIINFFPFKEEDSQIKEGVELVQNYFETFNMKDDYDALHWDYTKMFIGPYELPAPLWESSYINKDGLLFQEETLRVRRIYLENSLESLHYGSEADDHLGLELDFMYQLSKIAQDVVKEDKRPELHKILADQSYFLREHLLNWTPIFGRNVTEHAQTDFYKGIVKILSGFLTIDKACLEEMMAEISY